MVYGILKLVNFAHGEVFMVGDYVGCCSAGFRGVDGYEASGGGFPLLLALVVLALSRAVSALLGVTIEGLAYRPVRSAPRLTPLITAIGVSLLLQNLAMLVFSPNPRRYPAILREVRFELGGVIVTNIKLAIFAVALSLMFGLHLFVQRTWTGRAMRALSMNLDAAR